MGVNDPFRWWNSLMYGRYNMRWITELLHFYSIAPINSDNGADLMNYVVGAALSVFGSSGCGGGCVNTKARDPGETKIANESPVGSPRDHHFWNGYEKMRSAFPLYVLWLNRGLKTNLRFSTERSGVGKYTPKWKISVQRQTRCQKDRYNIFGLNEEVTWIALTISAVSKRIHSKWLLLSHQI